MNTQQSDAALIKACLRREPQAQHEFCVRFRHAVQAGAARAIGKRLAICGTADDLTNQFFLQVVGCPKKVLRRSASRSDPTSWLTAVAHRQCSKILRSHEWRWPGNEPVGQVRNLDTLPAPVHSKFHAVDVVRKALEQLDDPLRAIIEARFGLGSFEQAQSVEQIAHNVGCSPRTIYRWLHESLGLLRALVRAVQENSEE